jgi:alkylation response protein AidB-like acyl-CoA dehydrogenase
MERRRMRDDVIGHILKSRAGARACADVAAWWPRHRALASVWRNPLDRAIAGGFAADRLGWAFASGYQAALHALFPALPEDRICALCVTEAGGNHPRAIASTLTRAAGGWRLDGAKRWTTLGPQGGLFLVAARDAAVSGERVALHIARVPSDSAGVTIEPMTETRFVPEVPHARLRFDNVGVADDALLPGDGYDDYVKRFRTVEDIHVHAAVLAYLVGEARRLDWPPAWLERAAAALHALRAIAQEDPSLPATHIALAGALAIGEALVAQADTHWRGARGEAAARWQRDKELLEVAGTARALRTARAWERMRPHAAKV